MIRDLIFLDDAHVVRRRGRAARLSPQQFAILKMIAQAEDGICPQQIFNEQYQSDPNGGPERGRKHIQRLRPLINERIAHLGLVIDTQPGWHVPYQLKVMV